jgi:excisionase family DNA binding protein
MEPLLLAVPEACRVIGVSRSTLYELISAGDLSIRKIGRKTLIPRDDLTAFASRLATNRPKTGAGPTPQPAA